VSSFVRPDWIPALAAGSRILVIGASGGLGTALTHMLLDGSDCFIGAHCDNQDISINHERLVPLRGHLESESSCDKMVKNFCKEAGGIDGLIVLAGGINFSGHWNDMPAKDWENDIQLNLNQPFYLARTAMKIMKTQNSGGRIVLNGTESALHGGSAASFSYAIAKRGTECLVQGLAREGAADDILVNGVRLGYIESGFHQRWHQRTEQQMQERADLVPLKRGGHPDEAAALIIYLLSGWAGFITGQMIPLTGGDWL